MVVELLVDIIGISGAVSFSLVFLVPVFHLSPSCIM